MKDEHLAELRDELGREPGPYERLSWAHIVRARQGGFDGLDLLTFLRDKARSVLQDGDPKHDEDHLVENLEGQRDRRVLDRRVVPERPLSEEDIVAAYDTVLDDVRAGRLP